MCIIIFSTLGSIRSRGLKQKLKADKLEQLELVLTGCWQMCQEWLLHVVALDHYGQSLVQEGFLVVVISVLSGAPY